MALVAPPANLSPKSFSENLRRSSYTKKKTPLARMLYNGYPSRGASGSDKIYKRLDSCLVIPPPSRRKPKAVVKFLGGAFVGAVPEATYSYLMELLAREGYLIVSVPYSVTFDHERAAKEVYERFHSCMEMLFSAGLPQSNIAAADLLSLPLYSVGHSNGALLQLLVGCYFSEKLPKANAIISFNNRPASEAVPYFEQLGPAVRQVLPLMEASPFYYFARDISGNAWKNLLETTGTLVQNYDKEAMVSLNNFVDQLPSVLSQVADGISEFRPTPPENREFFQKSYSIPHTLLVKFSTDAIDETDRVEELLIPRVESIGGSLKKVTLSGNHLTPCVQDLKWQVGNQYTPADAVAQGLKSLSLNDTRMLARTISDWFRDLDS